MLSRLFLLFVVVPLVELMLLIQVGQRIGLIPTLLIVLATGAAGAALARREGLRTLMSIQSEMAAGRMPGSSLLDGAAILIGGAFLLTPGILTDLVGFSLLFPFTRGWMKRRIARFVERQVQNGGMNVRVVGFGPGGFGAGFGAGAGGFGGDASADPDLSSSGGAELGGPRGPDSARPSSHRAGLDPSKEISQD